MKDIGQNSGKGSIFKLNVWMEPIEDFHLENVDWSAKVFTENGFKSITIDKKEAIKVDADNYIIVVDSAITGPGRHYVTLTAQIPDGDVKGGVRQEVKTCYSGVTIDPK